VKKSLTQGGKYTQARARGTESNEFIGIMIDFTEKRQLEKEATRLAEETEQLILSAAIAAEEKEKQRISEALHDGIAQQLYGLKLSLDAFKDTLGGRYRHFDALLNNTIADVRNISFELTPAILVDFGLIETLKELAKRLSGSNLKISLNLSPCLKNLQTDIQLSIYRIVQELVNNSIRHGKAGHISIGIEINDGAVAVSVVENGAGFSAKNRKAHNSGTGLASIRNRLKLYDGTLKVISKLKKGTSVSIILKQFH
jgi:signal transduction histidine kinase